MCKRKMFFVFFKQKTAYEMRISDWSSDVCSSDLGALSRSGPGARPHRLRLQARARPGRPPRLDHRVAVGAGRVSAPGPSGRAAGAQRLGLGRAVAERKSVVEGKSVSVV